MGKTFKDDNYGDYDDSYDRKERQKQRQEARKFRDHDRMIVLDEKLENDKE
jgi:hypothetical protein